MKLYLVEIGTDHLKYKYLSDDLNLYVLNKLLKKEEEYYPILNNNDHHLIKDCGGPIVLNGDLVQNRVWIINIEHEERCVISTYESKFSEMVNAVKIIVKRDIKLESISKQL
jgi:hypothetical protein